MFSLLLSCVLLGWVSHAASESLALETCTSRPQATLHPDADVFIGALLGFSTPGGENYGCGGPAAGSMQEFEAMRWALDRINQDSGSIDNIQITDSYIPGVKIGMIAQDTCESPELAIDSVLDFYPELSSGESRCTTNSSKAMAGIISNTGSTNAKPVTKLLTKHAIPHIAILATDPSLSDSITSPYFMRTIPRDKIQIQTMLASLKTLGWTNVAIVYTGGALGTEGFNSLKQGAMNAGVCISQAIELPEATSSETALQEALTKLVEGSTTGVVYFGDAQTARNIIEAAQNVPNSGRLQWLMPETVGTDSSIVQGRNYARGILTTAPASRAIAEFQDYWVRLNPNAESRENPWYRNWYMAVNRCRLSGVNYAPYNQFGQCPSTSENQRRARFQQGPYVQPGILALFTYAKAIKAARDDLCRGLQRGLCQQFYQMSSKDFYTKYLKTVDLTFSSDERIPSLASNTNNNDGQAQNVRFDANGDLVRPSYALYNYNDRTGDYRFNRVGTYTNGRLSLNRNEIRFYDNSRFRALNTLPESRCPATGCTNCLSGSAAFSQPALIPGDVLIGGLFSVHQPGTTSLSCGGVDKEGAELVEAFLYGKQYAEKMGLWPNKVKLGLLAFDDCSSPELATNIMTNFENGKDVGANTDSSKLYAYTAGNTDAITLGVTSVLGDIPKPQVGYKPVSAMLENSRMFPFFTSIVPGKDDKMNAIIELIKKLGVSKVLMVHDNQRTSMEFLENFRVLGVPENVCIGEIGFSTPNNYDQVLNKVKAEPDTNVLFLYGDTSHFEPLLKSLNRTNDADRYLVLPIAKRAAEAFTNKRYMFRTLLLSFKSLSVDGWDQHLSALMPGDSRPNPWLDQWYQSAYNCYLDSSNTLGYPSLCQNVARQPIISSPGYKSSVYSGYVVMAVAAVARALDKTLQEFCGGSYSTVCDQVVGNQRAAESLMQNIVKDPLLASAGADGYEVEYLRPGANVFIKVGDIEYEATPNGPSIKLNIGNGFLTQIGMVKGSCTGLCTDCLYMYEHQASMYLPGDLLLAGLFNVHDKGTTPFNCGDIRTTDGFQYSEVFRYAIDRVNRKAAPVSLNGIKLGGIALDACSSDLRSSNLVSSIYSGAVVPTDNEGMPVNVGKIKGWLMYTSDISVQAAQILGRLGIGAISPSATSVSLNEESKFPSFYRTVPADDKLALAMAKLIDYLGWEYVQTINSPDTYGQTGIEAFKKALQKSSSCTINSMEYMTDGDADAIIARLLASSTSVVVIFGGQDTINELLAAKNKAGNLAEKLVFITSEKVMDDDKAQGTLSFNVNSPSVQGFNAYLDNMVPGADMPNPWFNEIYEDLYKCNLPGGTKYDQPCQDVRGKPITNAPGYQQDVRVLTTVNAIYALVSAIDLALKDRCGINYNGICEAFRMSGGDSYKLVVSKLNEVAFSDPSGEDFAFLDRQHDRGYNVFKYGLNGDARSVGSFRGTNLVINDPNLASSYSSVVSECQGSCSQCQFKVQEEEEFTFNQGDILLAGLFDVHASGQGPFSCGQVNLEQGWQLVEAFNYAIGRVNNKTGFFNSVLPGIKLGGLALDTCSSPTRTANLVANIKSGRLPLEVGNTRVNPDKIEVYIGAYDSDTSAAVGSILNVVGIPQLSYGSTATIFKDPKKYPSFLRTVPADDKLARAIVALLSHYKLEYVQVIHSAGTYGDDATSEFVKLAKDKGICVAQSVRLAEDAPLSVGNAERAVRSLLKKPKALIVITFISTSDINTFLKAVTRVPQASRFKFVGSDTWANRLDPLEDVGDVAANALTLGVETADLSSFDLFLRSKTLSSYRSNPWFDEYYEAIFECSLTPGSTKYSKQCDSPQRDIVRAPGYKQDAYVLYTVNAVYSAALGIDMTLKEMCGQNYRGLCDAFRNAGDRHQKILEDIRKATFQDATNQQFEFTKDGESNRGYHIYTARKPVGGTNYYYENVGSYNDTHLLKIRPRQEFEVTWKSDCSVPGACEECADLGRQPTRAMEDSRSDLNLVGFFDVHQASDKDNLKCGDIRLNGFQNVAAFFYAIDLFNKQNRFGVDLGGLAIDTCSNPVRVTGDVFSLLNGQGLCSANGIGSSVDPASIAAVIPMGSTNSEAAASLLSPKGITTFSPSATTMSLSDKPYFLRSIPPENKQAEAMDAVVRAMGFKYVSTINSDNDYGNNAMKSFFKSSHPSSPNDNGVCIGKRLSLKKDATIADAEEIVRELNKQNGANAVVMFADSEHSRLILQAAKNLNLEDRFTWLGSEAWGNMKSHVTQGLESAAVGSMALQVRSDSLEEFMKYLTSLTVANHGNIPDDWFEEFWQKSLKCKLENSTVAAQQYARVCSPSDRLSKEDIVQGPYVLQTIMATYVTALGLTNADDCQGNPLGIAGCLQEKGADRRKLIYEGIRGTSWEVFPGQLSSPYTFKFTPGGFGNTGFTVLNFQRNQKTGNYEYVKIGQMQEGTLSFTGPYVSRDGSEQRPSSSCPPGRVCACVDYEGNVNRTYGTSSGGGGSFEPVVGRRLDENIRSTWGIVIAALTGLGILVTLCAFVYLLIFYPIKGGTTVLGFILLFAVLCMFALVFAFILNDVKETCGIRRFCLGLVYALAFSCMLVKVLNTWRLGSYFSEYLPSYERLAHPCSLVLIALGLTLVQVIIGVEWLILEPPDVSPILYEGQLIQRCAQPEFHNKELVLSCIYVMVLMLLTLIFAGVTWDSEENHRESRWLLITTCFTIGIMIIWTIVTTLADIKYREPAIAIALLVNATIILITMFVRKIFLLNKYQKEADDERKSQFTIHDESKDHSFYSTHYNNQAFDTSGDVGSRKGSQAGGSGLIYVYDGTTGQGGHAY